MRRYYMIGFLVLMGFDTLGQFSFKLAAMGSAPASFDFAWLARVAAEKWTYGSIVGYVGAFFTYLTLLRHAPVGPAFAASHMEIVSVLALSALVLGESLTVTQALGAVCIGAGILLLAGGNGRAASGEALSPDVP